MLKNKAKLATVRISKIERLCLVLTELRLKEKGRRVTHNEIWGITP
jgi:hypothetical protein